MRLVQAVGSLEPQFQEICAKAIDKQQFKDVTTLAPGNEFEIEHGFGTIPIGFLVINADSDVRVYKSATDWDTEKIYLTAYGGRKREDPGFLRLWIFGTCFNL